jgi:hypothetical protein
VEEIVKGTINFWPKDFTLDNYKQIFIQQEYFPGWLFNSLFISGVHFVDAGTLAGTKEAKRFFSSERHMIHEGFISNDAETRSKSLADFVRMLFYKSPSVEDYYFILGYNTIVPPYVRQENNRE